MRIDMLIMGHGGKGGLKTEVNLVCSFLAMHGCSVRYAQILDLGSDWVPEGIDYCCLGMQSEISLDEAKIRYASLLRSDPPDLILATAWPYNAYIAKAATAEAGLPVPVVSWLHTDLEYCAETGCGDAEMLQFADMVFAINHKIARDTLALFPEKIVYRINNSIATDDLPFSIDRNHLKLAYVGRLNQVKLIPIILYALEQTALPWELFLAGDGEPDILSELKSLTKELHLEKRVHFLGWTDKPYHVLKECRATVIASMYEGCPLTAIEGLLCGMQVVSTPCGIIPETIQQGENGYVFSFGDPRGLADALDLMGSTPFSPDIPHRCRASALQYLPGFALWDFYCKTISCARMKMLPQRFDSREQNLYVDDTVQVWLNKNDFSDERLARIQDALRHQSIGQNRMEIVVSANAPQPEDHTLVFRYDAASNDELPPDFIETWYLDQITSMEYFHRM